MTNFVIGAGFGVVGIACLFMVFVWITVARDKTKIRDRRFRIVAWAMATSSLFLSVLCFNRASEQILNATFPLWLVYISLTLMGAAKVVLMSSSAIDGDRKMAKWFIIVSVVWVAVCAWKVFG